MHPDVERVWGKVAAEQSRFQNSEVDQRGRRLVVGDFAASVSERERTTPAHLKASVGWSIAVGQNYDVDATFRRTVTHQFESLGDGRWRSLETGETTTDEQIIEWMLDQLSDWIASNGRR